MQFAHQLQVESGQATSTRDVGSSTKTWLWMTGVGCGCFALGVASACLLLPGAMHAHKPVHQDLAFAPMFTPQTNGRANAPMVRPRSSFAPRANAPVSTFLASNAQQQQHRTALFSTSEQAVQEAPANLIKSDVLQTAIHALRRDMAEEQGVEYNADAVSADQFYAIGRLEAQLPLTMVGSISLAQCDSLVLINALTQQLAEWSGLRALDTVVAISSGSQDGVDYNGPAYYSGSVREANIEDTAQVYSKAIEHATANGLDHITLEINRLVPLYSKPVEE